MRYYRLGSLVVVVSMIAVVAFIWWPREAKSVGWVSSAESDIVSLTIIGPGGWLTTEEAADCFPDRESPPREDLSEVMRYNDDVIFQVGDLEVGECGWAFREAWLPSTGSISLGWAVYRYRFHNSVFVTRTEDGLEVQE